jgi:RNA polymerase sigma factor (sigma-70 family)
MNDQELIKQILKGDLGSFNILVKQHERLVFHMVRKLLGNKNEDVEDLCQEVFLKIYKNLGSFKNEAKLSTWIGSIAYRTAIQYCQKNGIQTEELTDATPQPSNEQSPEKTLIQKDERTYLQEQIERLPAQYKTCLLLFHYEEMSLKDIEKTTGWPEGSIKSYLHRGRKMLKDQLEQYQQLNQAKHETTIR